MALPYIFTDSGNPPILSAQVNTNFDAVDIGVFNVTNALYGAVGDGSTNDTPAFNAAIAAMPDPVTQPATGGYGPNHSGAYGAELLIPPGTYYLATLPNWHSNKIGKITAEGAVMTGPGAIYPSQLYLVDPAATTYPAEPAMLYITEPKPSNRSTLLPQNDDVTGIHIEHYNSGRAGIAVSAQGSGDAIFIGLSSYSAYGLDIVTYSGTPSPVGPMLVLNNISGQDLNVASINDYGAGYTILAELQKTGSSSAISVVHSASTYAGNILDIQTQSGSGSFTGEHAIFNHNGSQTLALNKENPYITMGPTFTSLGTGTGAPTYNAEGGSLYLRIDGTAGARLYVNQGSGGFSTTWTAVSGV